MLYAAYYNPEQKQFTFGRVTRIEMSDHNASQQIDYFEILDWAEGCIEKKPDDPVLITSDKAQAAARAGQLNETKRTDIQRYIREQNCKWKALLEERAGRHLV